MHLTTTERITILMMREYGDKMRSHQESRILTYPNRDPISKATVYRTVSRFERTGSVAVEQRSGRSKTATNDDVVLEVLQSVENHHKPPSKIAQECNISRRSVMNILTVCMCARCESLYNCNKAMHKEINIIFSLRSRHNVFTILLLLLHLYEKMDGKQK
ncbi:hypothetical protein ALC60_01391 [Trachymyrmex zeteki]|uniref:DUF4817 domain-containing protein n=1 Tax=Mycetomoellerius zeteki TaxID=64791 RepID=A0A151XGQ5_9HYME|nr:hypothetical protein ALC60_01391 [Trachymyrmex zeteki]